MMGPMHDDLDEGVERLSENDSMRLVQGTVTPLAAARVGVSNVGEDAEGPWADVSIIGGAPGRGRTLRVGDRLELGDGRALVFEGIASVAQPPRGAVIDVSLEHAP